MTDNPATRAADEVKALVEKHRAWARDEYEDSGSVYASLTGMLTGELTYKLTALYILQERYARLEQDYVELQERLYDLQDKYADESAADRQQHHSELNAMHKRWLDALAADSRNRSKK